ncbi:energy transducer TonB [Hymenobacter siberiensis]|uniref:energy transducer TonB n=1 Tax=Hymenobacter siberiensis TaxID=2848396 RepID=UPI001C1E596D|nr:energy transducer TonB [Hymenobacter siberiensis]MBU6121805.1 TonB family protein [Hymenobacter siberiensis]
MKFKWIACCVAGQLLGAGLALGQTSPTSATGPTRESALGAIPPKRVSYIGAKGQKVASAEKADHREELVYRDSIGGNLRVYYPSGNLRRVVPYLHFGRGVKYGVETSFYETGEVKSRCEYRVLPVGAYEQFYRDGKIRSRIYLAGDSTGKAVNSEGYLPDGTPATESTAVPEKMPTYRGGGSDAIVAAIQQGVRYPAAALRAQVQGRVFVNFMVDDAGFIRNSQIVTSPSPLLNATVLQSVASLGRLTPGEISGDTVDVFFTVPITFSIQ